MVICQERGADLHMAQLMPLPLSVSCFSKIQIGFIFLVRAHPNSPGKGAVKRVCVYYLLTYHRYTGVIHGPDLQNILRQSYDNAKVTIDLRRMSSLQNILQRAQGFSHLRFTCKIVRSSETVFAN